MAKYVAASAEKLIDTRVMTRRFIARALRESNTTVAEMARKSGVTNMNIYRLRRQGNKDGNKNGCRFDTLVALLGACGFELRMTKKRNS